MAPASRQQNAPAGGLRQRVQETGKGRELPRRHVGANVRLDISIARSRQSALGQSPPLRARCGQSPPMRWLSKAAANLFADFLRLIAELRPRRSCQQRKAFDLSRVPTKPTREVRLDDRKFGSFCARLNFGAPRTVRQQVGGNPGLPGIGNSRRLSSNRRPSVGCRSTPNQRISLGGEGRDSFPATP